MKWRLQQGAAAGTCGLRWRSGGKRRAAAQGAGARDDGTRVSGEPSLATRFPELVSSMLVGGVLVPSRSPVTGES